MSFNSFYANSCLSPKDVEKSNAFFKIVPYDEEINSGKQNVLTKIQYYDTLNTLPQHSWRMSLWSEWELELQRLITVVKCMHFFILRKKHCSIFVNIFYNKRCNYWLCGVYWITWLMIFYEGLKTAFIINLFWRLHLGEKVSISFFLGHQWTKLTWRCTNNLYFWQFWESLYWFYLLCCIASVFDKPHVPNSDSSDLLLVLGSTQAAIFLVKVLLLI